MATKQTSNADNRKRLERAFGTGATGTEVMKAFDKFTEEFTLSARSSNSPSVFSKLTDALVKYKDMPKIPLNFFDSSFSLEIGEDDKVFIKAFELLSEDATVELLTRYKEAKGASEALAWNLAVRSFDETEFRALTAAMGDKYVSDTLLQTAKKFEEYPGIPYRIADFFIELLPIELLVKQYNGKAIEKIIEIAAGIVNLLPSPKAAKTFLEEGPLEFYGELGESIYLDAVAAIEIRK